MTSLEIGRAGETARERPIAAVEWASGGGSAMAASHTRPAPSAAPAPDIKGIYDVNSTERPAIPALQPRQFRLSVTSIGRLPCGDAIKLRIRTHKPTVARFN